MRMMHLFAPQQVIWKGCKIRVDVKQFQHCRTISAALNTPRSASSSRYIWIRHDIAVGLCQHAQADTSASHEVADLADDPAGRVDHTGVFVGRHDKMGWQFERRILHMVVESSASCLESDERTSAGQCKASGACPSTLPAGEAASVANSWYGMVIVVVVVGY